MKVLLLNGSPHQNGCVFTALSEVAGALRKNEVETEIFWIGNQPVRGCIGCNACTRAGAQGCVFKDDLYNDFVARMRAADGIVIGSPVYYAGPAGSLCAFLDRVFYSAGDAFFRKPGAAIVNCRRGGASAAFDRLNKYFGLMQMPIVTSQYWNSTHGFTPAEVRKDLEGMQTMRTLGANMAHLLQSLAAAGLPPPKPEPPARTNFIR